MDLLTSLAACKGGETIDLGGATIPAAQILNHAFAKPVAITNGKLLGLDVRNSSGLTFSGVEMIADQSASPFRFQTCSGIVVENCDLHSDETMEVDLQQPRLLYFDGCSNWSVTGSKLHHAHFGIEHRNGTNWTIADNEFFSIREDGIRGGGATDAQILRNYLHDFYGAGAIGTTGDHCDAIQFWSTNLTPRNERVTIADNVIRRGEGRLMQGIYVNDDYGQGKLAADDLTITGNVIQGALFNGIYVAFGTDVTISNNIVQAQQDQPSYIRCGPTVQLAALAANLAVLNMPAGFKLP